MNPPIVELLTIPSSHRTSNTTAIVYNIQELRYGMRRPFSTGGNPPVHGGRGPLIFLPGEDSFRPKDVCSLAATPV